MFATHIYIHICDIAIADRALFLTTYIISIKFDMGTRLPALSNISCGTDRSMLKNNKGTLTIVCTVKCRQKWNPFHRSGNIDEHIT